MAPDHGPHRPALHRASDPARSGGRAGAHGGGGGGALPGPAGTDAGGGPRRGRAAAAKPKAPSGEQTPPCLPPSRRSGPSWPAGSVPPYVIFSNATLSEMARTRPQSRFDLLEVSGWANKRPGAMARPFWRPSPPFRPPNNTAKGRAAVLEKPQRAPFSRVTVSAEPERVSLI